MFFRRGIKAVAFISMLAAALLAGFAIGYFSNPGIIMPDTPPQGVERLAETSTPEPDHQAAVPFEAMTRADTNLVFTTENIATGEKSVEERLPTEEEIGLTQAALLFALGLAGHVKPVERIVDGVRQSIVQPQPEAVYATIRLFMSILPAILVLAAIILASQYPLDARQHSELHQLLEKRRAGKRPDPYSLAFLYQSLITAKASLSFKIFKLCVSIFIPRYSVEGVENIEKDTSCVLIANHLGPTGPMVTQLYLPIRHRPWAIDYTTQPRACYRHLRDVLFRETMHIFPPFNKLLAALTTLPCLWIMHGARAVPVHRGKKQIRKTFSKSINTLLSGESIVIFPEINHYQSQDGVKPFYSGFAHLGALHAKAAKKSLPFHPVYIDKGQKIIHIGSAVTYRYGVNYAEETRRVAHLLEERMRALAVQTSIENAE